MLQLQLQVPRISCSGCVKTVTTAIQELDPVATVQADPKTKLVQVDTTQSEDMVRKALSQIGYPAV